MQTRWLSAVINCPGNSRRSIASPRYNGPILIRGGSWSGITAGGGAAMDFGYVEDSNAALGNGAGIILENSVPIAQARAYTRFDLHRLHNDANALVEGMTEFSVSGPPNFRPLHFVIPLAARVVLSVHNGGGGGIVVPVNIEIVEAIPQAFLDCLKHLVM